jgi:hypothetical protein
MRAAVNSRGKALIAIMSLLVLLLAVLATTRFTSDAIQDGSSSALPPAAASATNDTAPKPVASPSVNEIKPDIASSLPVREQAPHTGSADRESDARSEMHAVEAVAMPVADSPEPKPRPRPGTVAAECWELRGSARRDFVVTLDREVRTSGEASALISSLRRTSGYTTMFQTAAAAPVRGKRVEFSADIRTRGATGSANLLLRAEDANGHTVAFDNMQTYGADGRPDQLVNRGVKGDTEWSTQHLVVDIPDNAAVITYGVSVFEGGMAWIDNARIEVVSNDVETTAIDIRQSPAPVHDIPVNPESLTRSPRNLEFDLEAQARAAPCN